MTYLIHDDYYKDITHLSLEERAKTNFDHPDSLDTALLISHVQELRAGRDVRVPCYDFATHARVGDKVVMPNQIVLVEGILLFADPALVRLLDLKVFVDTDADLRLLRRMRRDLAERGRTPDDVAGQYVKTVRPMHQQFVEPSKDVADVILPAGKHNDAGLRMVVNHLKVEAGLV